MKAFCCDRCGDFYTQDKFGSKSYALSRYDKKFNAIRNTKYIASILSTVTLECITDAKSTYRYTYELCPKCFNEFIKFLDHPKTANKKEGEEQ